MEVILFDHVKGLGRQGDLVKVSDGYFRNYLKPNKLAEEATPASLKRYETMKKKAIELASQKSGEAKELAAKLGNITVTMKAKAGAGEKLFGAVTTADIAKALEVQGFLIDKRQIETPEPIKTLGPHNISLKIHPEVTATIKLNVERLS
ncbi:MAG: 50S ribosomal protein L9 [Candidatus Sumerlaeaceae bacterium]